MLQQTSIFDFINHVPNNYKITKPIRLIELFAGIGSQAKALKKQLKKVMLLQKKEIH